MCVCVNFCVCRCVCAYGACVCACVPVYPAFYLYPAYMQHSNFFLYQGIVSQLAKMSSRLNPAATACMHGSYICLLSKLLREPYNLIMYIY